MKGMASRAGTPSAAAAKGDQLMNNDVTLPALALGLALVFPTVTIAAPDATAAMALARKSNCLKCHSVDKKKDGPAYKEVAAKYRGQADAEQKLFIHATTNPIVEVAGSKEEHAAVKSKNEAEIRNLVQWILAQ
jgi:cytochrome c